MPWLIKDSGGILYKVHDKVRIYPWSLTPPKFLYKFKYSMVYKVHKYPYSVLGGHDILSFIGKILSKNVASLDSVIVLAEASLDSDLITINLCSSLNLENSPKRYPHHGQKRGI